MARYIVQLRRFEHGANGKTGYSFSTKLKAVIFAAGYQAGIRDAGQTGLYVSVWDTNTSQRGGGPKKLFDTAQLEEIANREY